MLAACCSVSVCLHLHVYIETVGSSRRYLLVLRLSLVQHFSIRSIPLTALVFCVHFYFHDNC